MSTDTDMSNESNLSQNCNILMSDKSRGNELLVQIGLIRYNDSFPPVNQIFTDLHDIRA